jgi:hypothetical protein
VKVRPLKSNCKGTNVDCAQAAEIIYDKPQHHNKIKEINGLFHGSVGNDGSGIINNVPVIPQMNFATTADGTTANVTIPVCSGVIGGPCLDPNTHTITP